MKNRVIVTFALLVGCLVAAEAEEFDITYKVNHTHVDSTKTPFDVYTVEIYKDSQDTIKLAKFVSERDSYYYLSLAYTGNISRYMTGVVELEIDGEVSYYRDFEPYRGDSGSGNANEMVTITFNIFEVYSLKTAEKIRIQYQPSPEITISSQGIENIKRFIAEMESTTGSFLG